MAHLKEVIDRITSVTSTRQITKAMKMVAAAKLHKAQQNLYQLHPYAEKLQTIVDNTLASTTKKEQKNSYIQTQVTNPNNQTLIVVIAADRGLCGSFNKNVFKKTNSYIATSEANSAHTTPATLLVIGKKSFQFFSKNKYPLIETYTDLASDLSFEKVCQATQFIMDAFRKGTYDQVVLVHNTFKNAAKQEVSIVPFLPITCPEVGTSKEKKLCNTIYEPSQASIIAYLVPDLLQMQLYKALLCSNAAEHSARMTTMSKATNNANDLLKELHLTYNRTRQTLITKAISEIIGGAEALPG